MSTRTSGAADATRAGAAASCTLLHLSFVLQVSLTLIPYDFVACEAKRLCCSAVDVVRRLVEAATRESEERRKERAKEMRIGIVAFYVFWATILPTVIIYVGGFYGR